MKPTVSRTGRTYYRNSYERALCPCSRPAVAMKSSVPICEHCLKIEKQLEHQSRGYLLRRENRT